MAAAAIGGVREFDVKKALYLFYILIINMGALQLIKDDNQFLENDSNELLGKNAIEKVNNTLTDELFIGICSPIGSLKEIVIDKIKDVIKVHYNYEVEIIKLSEFIEKENLSGFNEISEKGYSKAYLKYYNKIRKGNEIRNRYNNSFLAEKSIESIHFKRVKDYFRAKNIDNTKLDELIKEKKVP